jgi:hypothetical protein
MILVLLFLVPFFRSYFIRPVGYETISIGVVLKKQTNERLVDWFSFFLYFFYLTNAKNDSFYIRAFIYTFYLNFLYNSILILMFDIFRITTFLLNYCFTFINCNRSSYPLFHPIFRFYFEFLVWFRKRSEKPLLIEFNFSSN